MGCSSSKSSASGASSPAQQPEQNLLAPDSQKPVPATSEQFKEHSNHNVTRKQPALFTKRHELDILVSQFIAHDSTVGSAVGRNCKDLKWKIMYDLDATPINIGLHVQEHNVRNNEVSIECDGQSLFQGAGAHAKAKMIEDFNCQWPFRATIKGINEPYQFELRPQHNSDMWVPATINSQRDDGFFQVVAHQMNNAGYTSEVLYPAVSAQDLREASTGAPLALVESCLMLHVPQSDPVKAVLSMNGEKITHHFGRASPPAGTEQRKLKLRASKDRTSVSVDAGNSILSHFMSGEVRSVTSELKRLEHTWKFQLGPFAEHTVSVTKKYTLGKIITLTVDGEVFVEASPADLGCKGSEWCCEFQFVGERLIESEVYMTNKDGYALETTGTSLERRKYKHKCILTVPNEKDLSSAKLVIDGMSFQELPVIAQSSHAEPSMTMDPFVLTQSYGITVPYKVDHTAPSGVAFMATNILKQAQELGGVKADTATVAAAGFCSCCLSSATEDHQLVTAGEEPNPSVFAQVPASSKP